MITKFRILNHEAIRVIEKLTYPRIKVEVDPGDPKLEMKNIDVVDSKCNSTELALALGEIVCYILRRMVIGNR